MINFYNAHCSRMFEKDKNYNIVVYLYNIKMLETIIKLWRIVKQSFETTNFDISGTLQNGLYKKYIPLSRPC